MANKLTTITLTEAELMDFASKAERELRDKLLALLKDDGKGHKHGYFAQNLADFAVKIVSLKDAPNFTAAIDWQRSTIFVSEGFLIDEGTFEQLSMIMRHELAHKLMTHQIRELHMFTDVLGQEGYERVAASYQMHDLLNIIADLEISHTRYTPEDITTSLHLKHNGRLIKGWVTAEHKKEWLNLTLEQMYDELQKECEDIKQQVIQTWQKDGVYDIDLKNDNIKAEIARKYMYSNITDMSIFKKDPEVYLKTNNFGGLPKLFVDNIKDFKAIMSALLVFKDKKYTSDDLKELMKKIAQSSVTEVYSVKDKNGKEVIKLYTPEEKFLAVEELKYFAGLNEEALAYSIWYEKVKRVMSNPKYSKEDVKSISDALDK